MKKLMLMAAAALLMGGVAMAQDFRDGARERRYGQGQMQRGEMQQRRQQGERGRMDRQRTEAERFERMAKMLRLDERQKREVRRIEADYRSSVARLRDLYKSNRKAIEKGVKRAKSERRKMMKRVLNREQFMRWEQMVERGNGPHGRGPAMNHRRGAGHGFRPMP